LSASGLETRIDFTPKGFDWKSLQQDALVVDIGGGIGSSTLQLMKAYPHLRYVIQERRRVITDGVKVGLDYLALIDRHNPSA
jgi:tRNA G46 methylase TrmB